MKSLKKVSLIIIAASLCSMATGCYEDEWDESSDISESTEQTAVCETDEMTDTSEIRETVNTEAAFTSEIIQTDVSLEDTVTDISDTENADVSDTAVYEENTEPVNLIVGGFNNEIIGGIIPEDSMTAWKNAFKDSDEPEPEPIALLGTQVVGGLNHSILCKAKDGDLKVYTIYERRWLDEAEILSVADFDLNNLPQTDDAAPQKNKLYTNAWTVSAEEFKGDENLQTFPENAADAFKKASSSLPEDIVLMPQAFLGSQVVAGTNYRFLCVSKDTDYENTYNASIKIVTVYEDLSGNAGFLYFSDLNASDYVKY